MSVLSGKFLLKDEYYFTINFNPEFIIDGGANIGLASVYFAKLFNPQLIIAVEPEGANFELLKKNSKDYAAIKPYQGGIYGIKILF